jgi:C1A family cysteine protease
VVVNRAVRAGPDCIVNQDQEAPVAKKLHVHPKLNKGYGWKPGLPSMAFPMYAARVELAALPPAVDLRPQCPPIYDQGQLGCCTGNGWAAAIQFLQMKQGIANFTPSRLFIYYNERVLDNDVPQDAGAAISDGAHAVSTQGCPHEDLWPYDITKFADPPPQPAVDDGLKHLALQVQQVSQDLTSMKEVLASGLPIVIGFVVYQSFETDAVTKTGIVPLPGHHEKKLGGHCVVVVGYDDSQSRFIMRNSWGTTWGMQGYFTMPYAYLTNPRLSSDFWMVTKTE